MAPPPLPLHPRSAGDILDHAVRLYRRQFLSIFKLILIPFGLAFPLSVWADSLMTGQETVRELLPILPRWIALTTASMWLYALGGGALICWVSDPEICTSGRIWNTYGRLIRRGISLGCLVALSFLLAVGGLIIPVFVIVGTVVVALTAWDRAISILVLVGIPVMGAFSVGAAVLLCRWSLPVSVLAIEDVSWVTALQRSWRLVRGNFWRAATITLFALVLEIGPMLLFAFPGFLLDEFDAPLMELLLTQVTPAILSPIAWIASGFLYFDCRIRHEALDLETMARKLDAPDENPVAATEGGKPSRY